MPKLVLRILLTLAISAAGGFVAQLFNIPGAWLLGGALATAIAALAGAPLVMPAWLRNFTFVLTGMSMGATVARDSLSLLIQWPITLAAMAIELVIIIAATGYMLRKLFKLDRGTAYMSSFPGHLSFVMGIAAAGVGDSRQITIIQVIRILMLTVAVPIGAIFLPIGHSEAPLTMADPMPLLTLLLGFLACLIVGILFTKLRVPAGYALGAMAASISAKFGGLFEGSLPPLLLIATFVLVGALIGSRFAGITMQEFRQAAVGGIIATAMTIGIVTIIAVGATALVDMPFGQVWLGLSPGGIEGMGALGIALGFDTAFIAAHHVARLLFLTFLIPLVVVLIRGRS